MVLVSVASQQLSKMHRMQILGVERLQSAEKLEDDILLIDVPWLFSKSFNIVDFKSAQQLFLC